LFLLAVCLYNIDKYEESFKVCEEALRNNYSREECYFLLGINYEALEKYPQSERNFLEALRINPQWAQVVAAYSLLMLRTGNHKKAEELMKEAARLDPNGNEIMDYKLRYYYYVNNKEMHSEALRKYIRDSSDEIKKFLHLSINDLQKKNYKSAKENCKQAFLLDPTNEYILLLLKKLDFQSSKWYMPIVLIEKVGGPAVLWVAMIVTLLILRTLKLYSLMIVVAGIYILLCLYSYVISFIYNRKNLKI